MSKRMSYLRSFQIRNPQSAIRNVAISVLTVLLLSSSACGQGSAEAVSSPKVLRLGMAASMFTGVNLQDAKAALTVWGDAMMSSMAEGQEAEWVIFADRPSMLHAVRTGQIHLIAMTSLDYLLSLRGKGELRVHVGGRSVRGKELSPRQTLSSPLRVGEGLGRGPNGREYQIDDQIS